MQRKIQKDLAGFLSDEWGSWNLILKPIKSTAALPGQTTKTALTEEFMFQNVAYWPTVYRTGIFSKNTKLEFLHKKVN